MDNVALLNEGRACVRDLSPAVLQRAITLARFRTDDELEIDDAPATSPNAEGGVWVAAWIYVGPEELFPPDEEDAAPLVLVTTDAVGCDASGSEADFDLVLAAARDVFECWNSGDLAGAVRHLAMVVGEVEAARSFEASAVEASVQSSAAHG